MLSSSAFAPLNRLVEEHGGRRSRESKQGRQDAGKQGGEPAFVRVPGDAGLPVC